MIKPLPLHIVLYQQRAEAKYNPNLTREIAWGSCLSCFLPFEIRWRRDQRRHGCLPERENWLKQPRVKKTGKRHYTEETWEKMKAKQREANRNARGKGDRHPCPRCGVKTINVFNCPTCLKDLARQGDLDAIMIWNMGEARRVTTRGASYDMVF